MTKPDLMRSEHVKSHPSLQPLLALLRGLSAACTDGARRQVPHVGPRLIRFAAVVSMMTIRPALAASIESPEAFVRRVYALYRNDGPGVPMKRPRGAAFYTAPLLDAFQKDTASPTGAGVTAEWDPICDCQAFSNLRIKSVAIGERKANRVRAQVAFINMRFLHTVTLSLSRMPVGWRIADIGVKDASNQDVGDRNVESIMALLQTMNAHPVDPAAPNLPPKP